MLLALMFLSVSLFAQKTDTPKKQKILSEVVVNSNLNKYKADSSTGVAKLPLKDLENPQAYNVIPKSVLKDQNVTNLNNALKNATGVTRLWESTGRGGDGAEYYTMRGFSVQPNLVNGMASINNGGLDPANIESIEVVKGPSGTLYGGNLISYGGLINIVTKKPYEKLGGEISYISGSFGLDRFTADINAPVNNNLMVRVNAALHTENSFQDAGFNKSFYIAPSVKFIANEKLTFLLNTEFKNTESVNAPMIFLSRYAKLSFDRIDLFEQNYNRSFTSNNLTIKTPTFGVQTQMLYKISSKWTSQTILSKSNTKTNGYYQYLWDASNGDEFTRFISKRNGETNTTGIQQNFTGDFKIGTVRNRVVIGIDFLDKQIQNNSTGWAGHGTVSLKNGTDNGILTTQAVDNTLLTSNEGNSVAKTKIISAYISDVINILPNLSTMLSVRVDNFSGKPNYWGSEEIKNQTTVSPKFGIIYQPVQDKVSIFGNYMNGFVNLDPAQVADINGNNKAMKVFDPEHANQWEFGTKVNLFKNKIGVTASYYNINVSNKVMTDPTNPNNSIQGGEVESKGFEFSLVGNITDGLNIITGFSNNQSVVVKDAADGGYIGFRPEEAGPKNVFNFWANYKVQSGFFNHFGIGFGVNAISKHKTLNRDNTGTFTLPSYNVFNAAITYSGENFNINLKLDNLSNEKYYSGWSTVTAQKPRSISLGLSFKF